MKRSQAAFFVALTLSAMGRADVTQAPLFREHAVLKRDKPVPVWGTAAPQEKIRVRFGGREASTTADAAGKWRVALEPLAASATPRELVAEGRNTVRVADVLVGEVWLCSGQSNMDFRVSRSISAKTDVPAANFPLIRQYDVPTVGAETPRTGSDGSWVITTPDTVRMFTAVGYYFAVELHRALGVPIGFIRAAPGGSRIESWMSASGESVVMASPEVTAPVAVRYAWSNAPETCLYNGAGLPVTPLRSDDW